MADDTLGRREFATRETILEAGDAGESAYVLETGAVDIVIEDELTDEHCTYPAGTWLRQPDGSFHDPVSPGGITLFVKRGHLPRL
jgi:CRP-like cAMP-binding protein